MSTISNSYQTLDKLPSQVDRRPNLVPAMKLAPRMPKIRPPRGNFLSAMRTGRGANQVQGQRTLDFGRVYIYISMTIIIKCLQF